jgi:PAS domain S-box-containing protein
MKDHDKTKEQLLTELAEMRQKTAALEALETERKRAEEALRRSEERYVLAQRAANIGSWDWDIRTRELHWSDQIEPMFGLEHGKFDANYKTLVECIHPEDRQRVIDAIGDCVREGTDYAVEHRIVWPTGAVRWVAETGDVVKDKNGTVIQVLGVVQDITEHKQAEETFRANERFLQTIFDGIQDGISVLDKDLNVVRVNSAMERWYSHAMPIAGRKCFVAYHGRSAPCEACPTLKAMETGIPQTNEVPLTGPSGVEGWLELYAFPLLDPNGNSTGVIEYVRNVTERKRADQVRAATYLISEAAHSVRHLDELFGLIHAVVGTLMPARNFYIALYDSATDLLSFPYWVNEHEEAPAPRKAGHGRTEYVLRTGKPLLASRAVFEEFVKQGEMEGTGRLALDWLGVPLKTGDKIIGVLAVQSYTKGLRFGEEEKDILVFVSEQVAMAIERKRAEDQLRQQNEYLSALHETTLGLLNRLNVADVLETIVTRAAQLLDTSHGYIYLAEPGQAEIEWKMGIGIFSTPPLCRLKPGEGLVGQVWQTGQPLVVNHYGTWSGRLPDSHRDNVQSLLGVPLKSGVYVVGVIAIGSTEPDRAFSDDDVELLSRFAQLASIALDNARLFQATLDERSHLQAMIESSRDGIILIGMEGHNLVINAPALQLLRLPGSPEDWLGRPTAGALGALRRFGPTAVQAALSEARRLQAGDESPGEGEFETPPRTIHWLNLPVRSGGIVLGRLIVLRDVTGERAVEQLREDMTRMMVHDLGNPLSLTVGALEFLRTEAAGAFSNEQGRALRIAYTGAQKMHELVNSILDVARLESGQMPLNCTLVPLHTLVAETLQLQAPLAESGKLNLESDVPSTLPAAWADARLIGRVLQNLVSNAVKYTAPGGAICVSATAKQGRDQPILLVSVSDTGPGIPVEIQGRLFQKFVRGRDQGRGSGLGLAFCKLAVEAHGGHIWLESTSKQGTTFTFSLPTAPNL